MVYEVDIKGGFTQATVKAGNLVGTGSVPSESRLLISELGVNYFLYSLQKDSVENLTQH
jgi:hypothetical protein